jgi:tetratricopeptide (TPR) repeat protein
VLDAAVTELLDQVPVVGGFAAKCWSGLEGDDAAESAELARFLEEIGKQQKAFEKTAGIIARQGELLQQSKHSLDIIRSQTAELREVRGDVKVLRDQVGQIVAITEKEFVQDPFRVSATLIDDHKRRAELVDTVVKLAAEQNVDLGEDALYDLAMLFMGANQGELAEACLLEMHHRAPDRLEALAALAQLYQRRAHEQIHQKNFGFAEQILEKARAYVKQADDLDSGTDLRLGYVYKELAQAYQRNQQPSKAKKPLKKARQLFVGVVEVEPDNASAWNGVGSVDIVAGDYASAVANIERAVALNPDYVEAWYDLAQVKYALSRRANSEIERYEKLHDALQAYLKVKELGLRDILLPPQAEQHLDAMFVPVVKWLKEQAAQ